MKFKKQIFVLKSTHIFIFWLFLVISDDEQIFKWIKELINGLYYLRKMNVIHRDIKPEYIYSFKILILI
jgi:serine/threonine protein kinase